MLAKINLSFYFTINKGEEKQNSKWKTVWITKYEIILYYIDWFYSLLFKVSSENLTADYSKGQKTR